jgi:hypothetical protein
MRMMEKMRAGGMIMMRKQRRLWELVISRLRLRGCEVVELVQQVM